MAQSCSLCAAKGLVKRGLAATALAPFVPGTGPSALRMQYSSGGICSKGRQTLIW